MPAPTNTSAATATVISGIPYMILLSADDVQSSPGLDHPLWWVFTNTSNTLISMFALGSLNNVTYPPGHSFNIPNIELFTGTPSSLAPYPPVLGFSINTTGSVQAGFLVRPITFYIKITVTGSPSEPVMDPLSFRIVPGRNTTAPVGSYIILSDQGAGATTAQWPAQVFGADGKLKQSISLVAGEQAYMFDDGTFGILDKLSSPEDLYLYRTDASLNTVVSISGGGGSLAGDALNGDGTSTFFVGKSTTLLAAVITEVDKDTGVIGSTWTLPADSKFLHSLAPSRDKTILYYQGVAFNNAVHRYDLVGNAPLADLAADDTYIANQQGLYVLKDGSITVAYNGGFGNSKIIRYNTAGAILNTYVVPSDVLFNLYAPYVDDPDSLLVWAFNATGQLSRFYLVDTATGVFTQLGDDVPVFEDGESFSDPSNTPPTFGIPVSCPLLVPRVELTVPDTPPPPTTAAPLPCCDALSPSQTASNPGPVVPPVSTTWTPVCRGGGAVPTAADIVNSEDWAA